jgi:hypothetical protein
VRIEVKKRRRHVGVLRARVMQGLSVHHRLAGLEKQVRAADWTEKPVRRTVLHDAFLSYSDMRLMMLV